MGLRSLTPIKSSARPFTPATPSGLTLWLSGADPAGTGTPPANNSTVSSWVDKSASGFNYSALVAGGTYKSNQFVSKGALNSNGSGQNYTLASHQILSSSSPFTIAFSAYFPAAGGGNFPTPLNFQNNTGVGYQMWYSSGASFNFLITGAHTGAWMGIQWTGGSFAYNGWNVFIETYNGSGAGTIGNYAGYINGTSVSPAAEPIGGNTGNVNYLFTDNIGDPAIGGTMFQNICVYNTVLSAGDISSLYTYLSTVGG